VRAAPLDSRLGQPPVAKLVAQGLSKSYGPTIALKPTDLTVAAGELMTILGPSGSGKTTLLQIICGLAEPTAGRLFIDGADQTHTPVHRRQVGVVFQNYALFPHLTVAENVAFPLQMRGIGAAELRCFVYQPSLILMDEPLGALDRKLRESMQIEIKRLHRDTGATILFVTHDQEEALALSDRICLMNDGRVEQVGTPQEIYEQPRNSFVAGFIGLSNTLRGRVNAARDRLVTPDGAFAIPTEMRDHAAPDQQATLVVRPEHVEIGGQAPDSVTGTVIETVYAGAETRLFVALESGMVITVRRAAGTRTVGLGETVSIGWAAQRARFLAD
jgi:putative spermidine/putrescine transport system ATP-binding protein